MVYANDQWVQFPVRDLYDTQVMAMAINAARDMYEKGQLEMKEFLKAYGDFMTPIAADLDWYNREVTGKLRDAVNALYAQGIDPLRNPQGRAMISKVINSMPYGEMAFKKVRAKNAEEYYKNMAALRLNDKYNEDFSKWLGEDPNQWAPDSAGITSPTAFKTLKEATNDWYNNRTPRDLTPEEKKQLGLDPRYNYTGYFDSDLMNVAKGLTPGWQGTPISNYYRELAKRKLQAAGVENPTAEQVEAVLQRDIANAQQEWLVGPKQGDADVFEKINAEYKKQAALQAQSLAFLKAMQEDAQQFLVDMAKLAAKDKLDQIRARYGSKTDDRNSDLNYSLTESIHHDMLFLGLRNSGIPIVELTTDKSGNVVPKIDKDGKLVYKNPDRATWEELEYAANHMNGGYIWSLQLFFKLKSKLLTPEKMELEMKSRYGARITGILAAAMLKRQPQKDGGFIISPKEAQLLRGTKGITADAIGSTYKMTTGERLGEIYNNIKEAIKDLNSAEIKFNISDTGNNAILISERYNKGRLETYANGSVTVVGKDSNGKEITKIVSTNAWFPLGLNSEIVAGNATKLANVSLSGANQSAYSSIDANYLKQMGQQQKTNIGLFANSGMPMIIDPNNIDIEDLYEIIQNNL